MCVSAISIPLHPLPTRRSKGSVHLEQCLHSQACRGGRRWGCEAGRYRARLKQSTNDERHSGTDARRGRGQGSACATEVEEADCAVALVGMRQEDGGEGWCDRAFTVADVNPRHTKDDIPHHDKLAKSAQGAVVVVRPVGGCRAVWAVYFPCPRHTPMIKAV
jgi:hypothetical protein